MSRYIQISDRHGAFMFLFLGFTLFLFFKIISDLIHLVDVFIFSLHLFS